MTSTRSSPPSRVRLKRRHQLALGGEGHLADALEARRRRARRAPIFASATRNAASVGSPWIAHVAADLAQHGVVREAPAAEHRRAPRRAGPRPRAARPSGEQLAPRVGSRSPVTSTSPEAVTTFWIVISFFVSVPVLSEQIDRGGAERLDRRQPLHDRAAARHALHAEREHHREDRRQALRHGGDGERDAEEQHGDEVGRRVDVGGQRGSCRRRPAAITITAMPSMRPMRATSRWSGVRCPPCAPSRRAIVPISVAMPVAGDDRAAAPACRPRCPLKTMFRRSPSAAGAVELAVVLQHRLALAGQRRLRDGQRRRLDEARVGAAPRRPPPSSRRRRARGRQPGSAALARRAPRRPSPRPCAAAPRPPARPAPPARSRARR